MAISTREESWKTAGSSRPRAGSGSSRRSPRRQALRRTPPRSRSSGCGWPGRLSMNLRRDVEGEAEDFGILLADLFSHACCKYSQRSGRPLMECRENAAGVPSAHPCPNPLAAALPSTDGRGPTPSLPGVSQMTALATPGPDPGMARPPCGMAVPLRAPLPPSGRLGRTAMMATDPAAPDPRGWRRPAQPID